MSEKRRLARNTAANGAAQILQIAVGFIFMPILIRQFSLEGYGIWLLASSVTGYLVLLDFGMNASLVKFVAQYEATGDRDGLARLVSSALVFYAIVGILAALIMAAVAFWGVGYFKLTSEGAALARTLFLASGAISLLAWPLTAGGAVLQGLQRYDLTARANMTIIAGTSLAYLGTVLLKESPLTLLLLTSGVSLVGSAWMAAAARRELGGVRVSPKLANRATFRQVVSFSWPIFVMQVAGVLVYQQTDRVVLGVFVGAASIALYEAASKMHSLVRQLAAITSSAVLPAASQLNAEQRHDTIRTLFLRGTKYSVAFIAPIVVSLMVLAQPLLVAWLGKGFASQTTAAQLYVSYWLLNANVGVASQIVVGLNRLRFILWYTIVATIANVTISVALAPRLGVLGVIIGTTVPYWIGFPFYMRFVFRTLNMPVSAWLKSVVAPLYPLLVVPIAVGFAARWLGLTGSLIGVAVTGVLCVGTYWISVALFALDEQERSEARSLLRSVRARLAG